MKIMIRKNRTDSENTRPLGRVCAITGLSLLLAVTAGCGKQGGDPVASTTLPAAVGHQAGRGMERRRGDGTGRSPDGRGLSGSP